MNHNLIMLITVKLNKISTSHLIIITSKLINHKIHVMYLLRLTIVRKMNNQILKIIKGNTLMKMQQLL